ncbi:peptidoglycan DD-metalloendopeptidase family protein [Streptomyces bobili]|uniref:aggregation-promoting factor C-terminal-like domain-containing protein n=1 Tax=Streptomyces bobili TaxID=67280 RepID=UPI000A36C6B7|nr:peptidoglycan DD-metalloendopeptidase family protein [Streptomyces bobili]
MPDLDIVGTAAVDIVPIAPQLHNKLRAIVLPAADRVGEEAGRRMGAAISRHLTVDIPDAVTNGGRAARAAATREGGQVGGALGNAIKRRLEVAFRSLPRADVRLGDTGFNADMDRIRARIQTLAGKTIGIDIDEGAALAEISAIDAALARLAAQNPTVQVRTDTAAARAALADVQRQLNDVDNTDVDVNVRVDTGNARRELMQLAALIGVVAAIPIAPVAVAGIGAIGSAAIAAGAGIGALALAAAPAIKGVTAALQAKSAAEAESARATDNSAASGVKAAQTARQLASAQSALSSAHRQAAQSIADANRRVADAERSLSDAKRSARQAEDALTEARRDARQELRSLQDQLLDGILDEREATLRVQEARQELARITADPKATDLQRQRAQLSVDEALRGVDKQRAKQAELKRSVEDAAKAGVDGNANVQAATKRVADADRRVADQSRAVADARRKVSEAQVQAAESVANAERGLQAARLSSVDTTAKSVTAADTYRQALAKLSPEQRQLFDATTRLKSAFSDWGKSLAPDTMPIFTRFVDGARRSLPGLSPLVRETAGGVKELQDAASKELKEPFWERFKKDIETSARPAVVGFGKTFGNVLKGAAGVVDAFLPHIDDIADRMVRSSGRFAKWGTGLKGNPDFEKFLAYAADNGPRVAGFLGSIAWAALEIGKALAPLSGPLLDALTLVVDGIASVAEDSPNLIRGVWLLVAAWKAWTIGIWMWNAAMAANPVGLVVLAIVALVAQFVILYKNVGWFRTAVDATWKFIQVATDWLWTNALKPFFKWFGDVVVWLWTSVVKPYVSFIIAYWMKVGDLFVWLWQKIIKPYIDFMVGYWRMVADVISWLWSGIFSPIFGFIGALIAWWWKNIVQKYFGLVMDIIRAVGRIFKWLYDVGVKPHVEKISDIVSSVWTKGLKPAFDGIKKAVGLVGDAFGSAKNAIGKHWKQVAGIAAKPVNFIIEYAYTKGIKAIWDKVGGFVGMDPLPKAPKLLDTNPKFLEAGGTVGSGWGVAAPMKVNKPTAIVGEGNPRYPEFVIPTDPKYRGRALALHQAAGTQLMEDGGILGGVWDWTQNAAGKAADIAKTGADLLANPSKVWDKLVRPILSKVSAGVGSSPMGKSLAKFPVRMADGLKDMIVNAATGLFGGGGGNGEWAKPVSAAFGTRFGVSGNMWSSGHHTGLDFPAPTGTSVRSVDAGSVIGVGRGGPYGNNLEIRHGGGLTSLYAHLSKMVVGLGEKVARGQQIGNVGATGNTTGPHLHLEARQSGRAIDPMPFLTGGQGGFSSRAVGSAQQYAKGILSAYGWGPGEFGPLQKLWQGESGWNYRAKNPSSGAYGIPQSLPANKMASAGSDWQTNPQTQIRWGLNYIKSRPDYGSPSRAYAKWLQRSPHWYDEGGYLPPGLSLVANGTGSPEPVFTSDQWATLRESAQRGQGLSADGINVYVSTTLDGRELTGHVDKRIELHDQQTATALNNGRWV